MNKEDVIALLLQSQKQVLLFAEQLAVMQSQRFGRKTEKLKELEGQLGFFNEAEAEAEKEEVADEPETEEITYRCRIDTAYWINSNSARLYSWL